MRRMTLRGWFRDGSLAPARMRQAVRRLMRAPVFTTSAVLTLMLGTGATPAVLAVVDRVLFRPLPYPRAGQLVDLSHTLAISGLVHVDQSDATYLLYRRDTHVFSDVGGYRSLAVNLASNAAAASGDGGSTERLPAALAFVARARGEESSIAAPIERVW
jgi:hypothetical protein